MTLSQRDPRWANVNLGTSRTTTIGSHGLFSIKSFKVCGVSSFLVFFYKMLRNIKNLHIFNSIVSFVSINMMYLFFSIKFSFKMFLHQISVFIHSFASMTDYFISMRSYKSAFIVMMVFSISSFYFRLINRVIFFITRLRTISSNISSIFRNVEKLFTESTSYYTIKGVFYHSNSNYCTKGLICQ